MEKEAAETLSKEERLEAMKARVQALISASAMRDTSSSSANLDESHAESSRSPTVDPDSTGNVRSLAKITKLAITQRQHASFNPKPYKP